MSEDFRGKSQVDEMNRFGLAKSGDLARGESPRLANILLADHGDDQYRFGRPKSGVLARSKDLWLAKILLSR